MMNQFDWDNVARKKKHYLICNFLCKSKRREIAILIKKWCSPARQKKVLITDLFEEATTSCGGIIWWLRTRYNNVFGIDISFEIVKAVCFKKDSEDGKYIVSDIRKSAFKDNSFDLIISNSTIDHFPELDSALKELYRILKPSGTLILALNNKLNIIFSSKMWFKRRLNIKDYSFGYSYSLDQMQSRVKKAGFTISDYTYLYFFPPLLRFFIGERRNIIREFGKKIARLYEIKMSSNNFLNKLCGSNIAMLLLK